MKLSEWMDGFFTSTFGCLLFLVPIISRSKGLKLPFRSDGTPCSFVFETYHYAGYRVRDCVTLGPNIYWRLEHRMGWAMSRKACQKVRGADLVSIHSFSEKRLVNDMSENNYVNPHNQTDHWNGIDQGVWIGLFQLPQQSAKTGDRWGWTDRTPLDYTDWLTGEPDHHAGKEHCVQLTTYLRGNSGGSVAFGWNDLGCMWGLKAICKARVGGVRRPVNRKH